ncbi:hypothetical protein ASD16_17930 [Cellulomonas sp. Root485]|nr:hypothetical protein ASD16_17930 [Cellulomonas sp. Root485]
MDADVTPTSDRAKFRAHILRRADAEAKVYLTGRDEGSNATGDLKSLIEGVLAPEYAGRTVIELLQNGHDAHSAERDDGELAVLLDLREGEFGTLYVANRGEPISDENFRGITGTGNSSKRPDESIGNKGIGFKSVLELSAFPEVYSATGEGASGLDGYRFRFARPDDFDTIALRIAPTEPGLGNELRDNLASLRVPVPLDKDLPDAVERFADEGYSTVIRLPIKSVDAAVSARAQVDAIISVDVPFHLFLDRISLASFTVARPEGDPDETVLVRDQRELAWSGAIGHGVAVRELDLSSGARYIVADYDIAEDDFTKAIHQSIDTPNWQGWKGPARVSIAFPLGDPLPGGRLFTFLPMGEAAIAPLPAFLNAPFVTRADRTTLDHSLIVNRVLLDAAAHICAALLGAVANDAVPVPDELVLDAASWTQDAVALERALTNLGEDLWELPFIPTFKGSANAHTSFSRAYRWPQGFLEFTAQAITTAEVAELIDPRIGELRTGHLLDVLKSRGWVFDPTHSDIAEWAEAVARTLHSASASPERWADFYDDLADTGASPAEFTGRALILDQTAGISRAGRSEAAPAIYFPPQQASEDSTELPQLPNALRGRVVFTSPHVPARVSRTDQRLRRGREWLARFGLVNEYGTETVLRAVAATMTELATSPGEASKRDLAECFSFAFNLYRRTSRDIGQEVLAGLGMRVPTATGWLPASEARFGLGWGGPSKDLDGELTKLVAAAEHVAPEVAEIGRWLTAPPQELIGDVVGEDLDALRAFVEALGVKHGLWPVAGRLPSSRKQAEFVNPAGATSDLPAAGFDIDAWVNLATGWTQARPQYTTTQYGPKSPWHLLPGQGQFAQLDAIAQRLYSNLVLRGIAEWPESALEVRFARPGDQTEGALPSPLAAFLSAAAWVPQTTPGARDDVTLVTPADAWWMAESETIEFLPAQPPQARAWSSPQLLERARRLGLRIWDSGETWADRLHFLADLVTENPVTGRTGWLVRREVERAWNDFIEIDPPEVPTRLIVSSEGQLSAVESQSPDRGKVYVNDVDRPRHARLVESSAARLLPIQNHRVGRRLLESLAQRGVVLDSILDVDVEVLIDGQAVDAVFHTPIHDLGLGWLMPLVVTALTLKYQSFPPLSPNAVAESLARLEETRVAVGRTVSVTIGGQVAGSGRMAHLVESSNGHLIAVGAGDSTAAARILDLAAEPLAQVIGAPSLADSLRLAIRDLAEGGLGGDPARDIARSLGLSADAVHAVIDIHRPTFDTAPTKFVLLGLYPETGFELHESATEFEDQSQVQAWLARRLTANEVQRVLSLSVAQDRNAEVARAAADLRSLNERLRAIGFTAITNVDGQAVAFRAYLQEHGSRLRTELRDRFAPAFNEDDGLDQYVRARVQLADLPPDPTWAQDRWDLLDEEVGAYLRRWLNEHAPAAPQTIDTDHSGVDETRVQAQRSLRSFFGKLPETIEAWCHAHHVPRPERFDATALLEDATASGRLDFRSLSASEVAHLLAHRGHWPHGMPHATAPTELGLTSAHLQAAKARLSARTLEEQSRVKTMTFEGSDFAADDEDLARLYEAARTAVPQEALATDVSTVELAASTVSETSPKRAGQVSPGRRGFKATSVPPEKALLIGLLGEAAVGEWIREQFSRPPEDTWVSGYRKTVFGDDNGDDSLGYDFRVKLPDGTLLFEVKSSVADDGVIHLAESEVRRAQDLLPGEEYSIIYVSHVTEPARMRIHRLPNPFSPGGLMRYRVVGEAVSLKFELAGRNNDQSP